MRASDRIALFRTALEVDGQLAGPEELHLHQHTTLPPKVQEMLEDNMVSHALMGKPWHCGQTLPHPPKDRNPGHHRGKLPD
jgi:hypothetical protein